MSDIDTKQTLIVVKDKQPAFRDAVEAHLTEELGLGSNGSQVALKKFPSSRSLGEDLAREGFRNYKNIAFICDGIDIQTTLKEIDKLIRLRNTPPIYLMIASEKLHSNNPISHLNDFKALRPQSDSVLESDDLAHITNQLGLHKEVVTFTKGKLPMKESCIAFVEKVLAKDTETAIT